MVSLIKANATRTYITKEEHNALVAENEAAYTNKKSANFEQVEQGVTAALIACAEYIINDDREREDYIESCEENGIDPYTTNAGYHIYGLARIALGLDPITK